MPRTPLQLSLVVSLSLLFCGDGQSGTETRRNADSDFIVCSYSSPFDGPDVSWQWVQAGETPFYRVDLSFRRLSEKAESAGVDSASKP